MKGIVNFITYLIILFFVLFANEFNELLAFIEMDSSAPKDTL